MHAMCPQCHREIQNAILYDGTQLICKNFKIQNKTTGTKFISGKVSCPSQLMPNTFYLLNKAATITVGELSKFLDSMCQTDFQISTISF